MFYSNSNRLDITMVPKERFAIKVFHLHNGNDEDGTGREAYLGGSRRTHVRRRKYATICSIIDRETDTEVAFGLAECSSKDTPKRRTGHGIALGRALKAFQTAYNVQGRAQGSRAVPTLRLIQNMP